MAPTSEVPQFSVTKGVIEVPGELLDGMAWENATLTANTKMTLFSLPMSVLGGYGKDFVEGLANARVIEDLIEEEYGNEIKILMQTMMKAVDHYGAIT